MYILGVNWPRDKTVTIIMSSANSWAPVGCKLQTKAASFTATSPSSAIVTRWLK